MFKKEKSRSLQKKNIYLGKKVTLKEQAAFFTSLADMLQAGFSLKKSLLNVKLLDPKLQNKVEKIITQLSLGATFSQTVEPWVSKQTYFQIKMAEQHGNLEQAIKELGKFLFRLNEQLQKLKGLLLYPLMLLVLLAGLCTSIKIWLVPKLTAFSNVVDPGQSVPFFKDPVHLVKGAITICLLAVIMYLSKVIHWWVKQKSLTRHVWYAQLPILGQLYRLYCAYIITFDLSLLFQCGLDIQQICLYLRDFKKNSIYYQLGYELDAALNQGSEVEDFILSYSFIPHELLFFLNNGDTKEEMSKELAIFSQNSYRNLLRGSERLLTWVQPLLFLVIAAIIIGTYLAILLPLYSSIGGIY
ncbi:competence protein ComG [Ligilactobacillus acidipiscis]|uniref:Competence protein ComG n=1 Tax=Ligilactobacillus acidipiscis TaxID=89059 RepID=A0A1K1KS82_9LACO|nr:competence protein ComG [Ligilactobacillus acidipiscis]